MVLKWCLPSNRVIVTITPWICRDWGGQFLEGERIIKWTTGRGQGSQLAQGDLEGKSQGKTHYYCSLYSPTSSQGCPIGETQLQIRPVADIHWCDAYRSAWQNQRVGWRGLRELGACRNILTQVHSGMLPNKRHGAAHMPITICFPRIWNICLSEKTH